RELPVGGLQAVPGLHATPRRLGGTVRLFCCGRFTADGRSRMRQGGAMPRSITLMTQLRPHAHQSRLEAPLPLLIVIAAKSGSGRSDRAWPGAWWQETAATAARVRSSTSLRCPARDALSCARSAAPAHGRYDRP